MKKELSIKSMAVGVAVMAMNHVSEAAAEPTVGVLPNVVVIYTDDQVFNAIGYNNPEIHTPNMDAMAAEGIIFDRGYVASPVCAASRAAVMTGIYPQQNGVTFLDNKSFITHYSGDGGKKSQTLPSLMSKAGYYTAAYGKSHLSPFVAHGFDEGDITHRRNDRETFSKTKTFITERSSTKQPFFLWLAPNQPHIESWSGEPPLNPERKWLDIYDPEKLSLPVNFRESPLRESIYNQGAPGEHAYRDQQFMAAGLRAGPPRDAAYMRRFIHHYYAVVSHLDHQIGDLVEQMKEAGVWENTVMIFMSDNGYHLGSHGLGNKLTMHEESVRVPAFARGPGIARGKRSQALVSSLDLYPTLLALAGAEIPEWAMGKDLTPLFSNPEATVRKTIFAEAIGVGRLQEGHRMAFDGRHKLVLTGTNELYLFDHESDPTERVNQFNNPKFKDIAQRLQSDLAEWMQAIGDRPWPEVGRGELQRK